MNGKFYCFYHGDDGDQIGQVSNFLNGQRRFAVLGKTSNGDSNDLIADSFGPILGLSRINIESVIRCPTLPGKRGIDGRQILSKAKIALKECKKLLSFWNEFLKIGTPSGMDETYALKHVIF